MPKHYIACCFPIKNTLKWDSVGRTTSHLYSTISLMSLAVMETSVLEMDNCTHTYILSYEVVESVYSILDVWIIGLPF